MMEQDQFYSKYRAFVPPTLRAASPRTILIGLVVLAAIGFVLFRLFAGSAGAEHNRDTGPPPVRVAVAVLRDVPVTVKTIGTVLANMTVEVKSRIDGQILSAPFQEGQLVKAGDLLFQIDPKPAQETLREAQAALARDAAQLASARAIANRTVALTTIGAASGQERDIATANARALAGTVAADQAAVEQAKLQLSYTQIRAPFAGKTGPILVHPGNLVKANDVSALVTITQLQPVKISFALPQADLPPLQDRLRDRTLTALIRVRNETGASVPSANQDIPVVVDFIGNAVSDTTGTVELRATFDNPDMRLVPGEQVDVNLRLAVLAGAVQVPREAVNAGQNGSYVYIVDRGHAVMRNVVVLYQDEHIAALKSGVRAGEQVVTDGQLRLTPGAAVSIVKAAP